MPQVTILPTDEQKVLEAAHEDVVEPKDEENSEYDPVDHGTDIEDDSDADMDVENGVGEDDEDELALSSPEAFRNAALDKALAIIHQKLPLILSNQSKVAETPAVVDAVKPKLTP